MKNHHGSKKNTLFLTAPVALALAIVTSPLTSFASGGSGGGGRYGGTVMGSVGTDPISVIIISSSGGSIEVLTTPLQI